MILRRNVLSQMVMIGPLLDTSNNAISSNASAFVNENNANGTLTHITGGCYRYTFTQAETDNQFIRLRLSNSSGTRAVCLNFATMALDASGQIVAQGVADIQEAVLQSNIVTEVDSPTIKLKISTTKAKTHFVTGNLTGKTLKLYVESKPGTFFAEFTATGANGSFSFTPSSTLTQNIRTFPAALREPSDGNSVLWSGNIEVAYAADAE